jgi:uncharacterized sporulation protein YeaH/YhbH (DUF444 family)
MSYIIDRRTMSKEKSAVNRQRFLRRHSREIKRAVEDAVSKRSITDVDSGEKISIPSHNTDEPNFGHGQGGNRARIYTGNKEFLPGEKIDRPENGGAGAGGNASNTGEGMDDFVFQITQAEFLDIMFDDLALPNLIKRQLSGSDSFNMVRAGFSNEGNPGQINIVRSVRNAKARRIALTGNSRIKVTRLREELESLGDDQQLRRQEIEEEISRLQRRINAIPFLDDFDLQYNLHVKQPNPTTKAVMFCLMDVSGSMGQETKDIAKRFFILLYLFLQRNYERTEVVFIRHHSQAKEVDEEEFFHSRETGGTVVSTALALMSKIIKERYPVNEWNIYGAQASDGDNWSGDSVICEEMLDRHLLPLLQYFCYIEICDGQHQEMWSHYQILSQQHEDLFAMQHIRDRSDIYPVFRQLFKREQHE